MRLGRVIGSTNRLGKVPQDRPVHYREVFATLYHRLAATQCAETGGGEQMCGGRRFHVLASNQLPIRLAVVNEVLWATRLIRNRCVPDVNPQVWSGSK